MGNQKAADKGPDNNKRLAALESGVSQLAIALAAAGVEIGEAGDPIKYAIELIEVQREAVRLPASMLVSALEAGGEKLAADADPVLVACELLSGGKVTKGEMAAIARAETAEKELGQVKIELEETKEDLERVASEKGRLANELAELIENKGYKRPEAAEEAPAAPPEPLERPDGARDFGPDFHRMDPLELGNFLASDPEGLEISFSNGDYELIELEPIPVTAAELVAREGRRALTKIVQVKGGEREEPIHGAALVLAGEQIDYCQFPVPLKIEQGQVRQFVRMIFFG